jgi:hypothetical protein
MATAIVGKSQFARLVGITPGRVSHLIAAGMPVRPDGDLDRRVALDWISRNVARELRPPMVPRSGRRGGRPPHPPSDSFGEARRLLEVLKAQRLKLEVDRLRGRLLEREAVVTEVFELGRHYRDAWLNWPSRVAAVLASRLQVDALAVQRELDVEVRAHLVALRDFTLAPKS